MYCDSFLYKISVFDFRNLFYFQVSSIITLHCRPYCEQKLVPTSASTKKYYLSTFDVKVFKRKKGMMKFKKLLWKLLVALLEYVTNVTISYDHSLGVRKKIGNRCPKFFFLESVLNFTLKWVFLKDSSETKKPNFSEYYSYNSFILHMPYNYIDWLYAMHIVWHNFLRSSYIKSVSEHHIFKCKNSGIHLLRKMSFAQRKCSFEKRSIQDSFIHIHNPSLLRHDII